MSLYSHGTCLYLPVSYRFGQDFVERQKEEMLVVHDDAVSHRPTDQRFLLLPKGKSRPLLPYPIEMTTKRSRSYDSAGH